MKYYVYRHIRLDKNTPCYVGKGKGRRAYAKTRRNPYHKNIINKGVRIEIVKFFENEEEAFKFEKMLIKVYKNYGYCEANFTEGGIEGWSHTDKSRKKIKINNAKYWKGKCRSKEDKLKISKTLGSKKVLVYNKKDVFIGEWENLTKCSEDLGLFRGNITHCLKGKLNSTGGFIFKYKKEN